MQLVNWSGAVALAAAAAVGYLTCEMIHCRAPAPVTQTWVVGEVDEASEAPPAAVPQSEPVEVIDLACLPTAAQFNQFLQTTEPPLAVPGLLHDGLRTTSFEFPAGSPDGPELPPATMPYLKDDGDDDAPARLPLLGEVSPVPPPANTPGGPLFEAVWKFFHEASRPVTDKVPPGRPPQGERPPDTEVGSQKPNGPGR